MKLLQAVVLAALLMATGANSQTTVTISGTTYVLVTVADLPPGATPYLEMPSSPHTSDLKSSSTTPPPAPSPTSTSISTPDAASTSIYTPTSSNGLTTFSSSTALSSQIIHESTTVEPGRESQTIISTGAKTMTTTPAITTLSSSSSFSPSSYSSSPFTPTPTPSAVQGISISGGQIAGITVGGLGILGFMAVIFFLMGRRNDCHVHGNASENKHGNAEAGFSVLKRKVKKGKSGKELNAANTTSRLSQELPMLEDTAASRPLPTRPANSLPYFYYPATTGAAEELEGSAVTTQVNTMARASTARFPIEHEEIAPIEMPTSRDPGNSPLPRYSDLATRPREFSWAEPETAYRPDKFEGENRV